MWLDERRVSQGGTQRGRPNNFSAPGPSSISGAYTVNGVADLLTQFGSKAFASWSEEEKEKVAGVMKIIVRERAVPFTRPTKPHVVWASWSGAAPLLGCEPPVLDARIPPRDHPSPAVGSVADGPDDAAPL